MGRGWGKGFRFEASYQVPVRDPFKKALRDAVQI